MAQGRERTTAHAKSPSTPLTPFRRGSTGVPNGSEGPSRACGPRQRACVHRRPFDKLRAGSEHKRGICASKLSVQPRGAGPCCPSMKASDRAQWRDFVIDLRDRYLVQSPSASVELPSCLFKSLRSLEQVYSETFVQRPERQPEETETWRRREIHEFVVISVYRRSSAVSDLQGTADRSFEIQATKDRLQTAD